MFFARYAIVERVMVQVICKVTGSPLNSDLSSAQMIEKIDWRWKRMFLKDVQDGKHRLDELYRDFFLEILMIILNFVTLISF